MSVKRLKRILSGSKIGRIIKKDSSKPEYMSRSELIDFLKEKVNWVCVDSGWVKKVDELTFDWFLQELELMVKEGTEERHNISKFERGEWMICYRFTKSGISYSAGSDFREAYLNSPEWVSDEYRYIDIRVLRKLAVKAVRNTDYSGFREDK